jgi:Caspase domain
MMAEGHTSPVRTGEKVDLSPIITHQVAAHGSDNSVEPRYNDPRYNNILSDNDSPSIPRFVATTATVPCYKDTAAYRSSKLTFLTSLYRGSTYVPKLLSGDEHSLDHLKNLQDFIDKLRDSAARVLQARTKYKKVVTLITYWQKPNHEEKPPLDHLRTSAKNLRSLFDKVYGFDNDVFEIPNDKKAYDAFTKRLRKRIKLIKDDEQSLFILYYGGHGKIDGTKALWKAELSESSGKVDWSSAQITLESSICDKLFLFDCCYAGAMIDRKVDWYGRTELLGSSKPQRKADSRERASFTKALIHELGTPGRDIISIWEDF